MTRSRFSSSKFLAQKRKRMKIRIALILGGIIFVGASSIYILNLDFLKIKNIDIEGNDLVDAEKVEEVFRASIEGKFFKLIDKDNILFYPKYKISEEIRKQKSEIASLKFSRKSLNTLNIKIIEHDPVGIFCKLSECFLLNAEGRLFNETSLLANLDLYKFTGLLENPEVGNYYAPENVFKNKIKFADLLKENNFVLLGISSEDSETFVYTLKSGPEILISKQNKPNELIKNLLAVLVQDSINDAQFRNLEYIDLRFGNKVYYKLK